MLKQDQSRVPIAPRAPWSYAVHPVFDYFDFGSMPSGGPRPNSGRPRGPNYRKNRAMEIAADAAARGISPIEVMLENMRYHHGQAQAFTRAEVALANQLRATGADAGEIEDATRGLRGAMLQARQDAQESAKDAAPYIHPRLQAIQLGSDAENPLVVEIVRFSESNTAPEPLAPALVPDENLERVGNGSEACSPGRTPPMGKG